MLDSVKSFLTLPSVSEAMLAPFDVSEIAWIVWSANKGELRAVSKKARFAPAVALILQAPSIRMQMTESNVTYDPSQGFQGSDFATLPNIIEDQLHGWHEKNKAWLDAYLAYLEKHNLQEFDDAVVGLLIGIMAGLGIGAMLDSFGIAPDDGAKGEIGEGLARWVIGNTDTLPLVIRTCYRKLRGRPLDNVDTFGLVATAAGGITGPLVHLWSESFGAGVFENLKPVAYANADNLAGSIAVCIKTICEKRSIREGLEDFRVNRFHMLNLGIISFNVFATLVLRAMFPEYSVTTQTQAAAGTGGWNYDTIAALAAMRWENQYQSNLVIKDAKIRAEWISAAMA